MQSALKSFHTCVYTYTQWVISTKQKYIPFQHASYYVFYCTSAYSSCYHNKPLTAKKYFSLYVAVLFMQSNASDVMCFCVEQGICSAGLEQGHRNGAGLGMGGHGTVPIRLALPKDCEFQGKWGAMPEPWFLGPGVLYSSHISFGEVKRMPTLPLSSRTLSGARQFPLEERWRLHLGSNFRFTCCG